MLILASSSPRRSMLLHKWGYSYTTVQAFVSEEVRAGLSPQRMVRELAERKARAGLLKWSETGGSVKDVIIGADTLVVMNGKALGKPKASAEAVDMLKRLRGHTHSVLTGVALITSAKMEVEVVETRVSFRKLSEEEILAYLATGEPMDKAGAYGIQGEAGKFVEKLEGSITNVIGLPMELLSDKLRAWGIYPENITSREVDYGLSFERFTEGTFTP